MESQFNRIAALRDHSLAITQTLRAALHLPDGDPQQSVLVAVAAQQATKLTALFSDPLLFPSGQVGSDLVQQLNNAVQLFTDGIHEGSPMLGLDSAKSNGTTSIEEKAIAADPGTPVSPQSADEFVPAAQPRKAA